MTVEATKQTLVVRGSRDRYVSIPYLEQRKQLRDMGVLDGTIRQTIVPGDIDIMMRTIVARIFGNGMQVISNAILDYYYSRYAVHPPGTIVNPYRKWEVPEGSIFFNDRTINAKKYFVADDRVVHGIIDFSKMKFQPVKPQRAPVDFRRRIAGDHNCFFYLHLSSKLHFFKVVYCGDDMSFHLRFNPQTIDIKDTNTNQVMRWEGGSYFCYHSVKKEVTMQIGDRGQLLLSKSPESPQTFYLAAVTIETKYQEILHAETFIDNRIVIAGDQEIGIWNLKTRSKVLSVEHGYQRLNREGQLLFEPFYTFVSSHAIFLQGTRTLHGKMFFLPDLTHQPDWDIDMPTQVSITSEDNFCFMNLDRRNVIFVYSPDFTREIATYRVANMKTFFCCRDLLIVHYGSYLQSFAFKA